MKRVLPGAGNWILAIVLMGILAGCEIPLLSGKGGGSETETQGFALTGQVSVAAHSTNFPFQISVWHDTQLVDMDAESLPTPVATAVSDGKGHFRIDSLPEGNFRVYFSGHGGLTAVQNLTVKGNPRPLSLSAVVADSGGSLSGRFDSSTSRQWDRFVQVYGIPRFARCDASGRWKLEGLPVGKHRLRYVTREPFRLATYTDSIEVLPGSNKYLGSEFSRRGVKLVKDSLADGLRFVGIDGTNPVVMDNELCINQADMAYILPAASKGHLNLRGWIVTKDFAVYPNRPLDAQMDECRDVLELSRQSGFHVGTEPTAGATKVLTLPASGRLVDMVPEPSAGVSLLLSEAAKATPEKPLVILAGGPLSTIASAYLLDPSLVERTVVFAMYSDRINSKDTLANYLVAQKFRFIHWGRGYVHEKDTNQTWLDKIPGHPLGVFARSKLAGDTKSFGDLPMALFLLEPRIFSGANARVLQAGPLQSQLVQDSSNGDFWDIEKGQNDFNRMQQAVFDSLENWQAPRQQIGALPGLSFNFSTGVTALIGTDDSLIAQMAPKSNATWNLISPKAGSYTVSLLVRNAAATDISVVLDNQTSQSKAITAIEGWQTVAFPVELPEGNWQLRIEIGTTGLDILNLKIE